MVTLPAPLLLAALVIAPPVIVIGPGAPDVFASAPPVREIVPALPVPPGAPVVSEMLPVLPVLADVPVESESACDNPEPLFAVDKEPATPLPKANPVLIATDDKLDSAVFAGAAAQAAVPPTTVRTLPVEPMA